MKRYLLRIALWFILWLPWLYVGVFAYTSFPGPKWKSGEFGWPYLWLNMTQGLGATNKAYDKTWYFSAAMLVVDILISVAITTVVFIAVRRWWRRVRSSGFRFRVSTLLLLVVFVSIPLAGWRYLQNEYDRESVIVAKLHSMDVFIYREHKCPLLIWRLNRFLPESFIEIFRPCTSASLDDYAWSNGPTGMIGELQKLSHLKEFTFFHCPVESLAILRELPGVKYVGLQYVPINEVSLNHLTSCQHLRKIDLTDCEVSTKAVEQLRKALPDTEIIYDREETNE